MRFFTRIAAKVSIFFESAKERGENNDYLISGEVLHILCYAAIAVV